MQPDPKGVFVLDADDAELHGERIKVETRGMRANIGFWDESGEWISWKFQCDKAGAYQVSLDVSTVHAGVELAVEIGGQTLTAKVPRTGDWEKFQSVGAGRVQVKQPGIQSVKVRPKDTAAWKAVNLRNVRLTPAR